MSKNKNFREPIEEEKVETIEPVETEKVEAAPEETEDSKDIIGTVINCSKVYVRSTPEKINGNELGALEVGSTVEVVESTVGEFVHVITEEFGEGYIVGAFVQFDI